MADLVEINLADVLPRDGWDRRRMVRVDCEWVVEPAARGYLITSPDVPGFILGADDANHVVAKVPRMLRAFLNDETVEPIYHFTGPT